MSATTAPATSSSPPLLDEFQERWRQVHDKTIFGALLGCWLALFWFLGVSTQTWTGNLSLLTFLWRQYGLPATDSEFAKLIPFAVLALLWHKRDRLAATAPGPRWPALPLFILGLGLHIIGFLAQQETISTLGFFIGLYSLIGLTWGVGIMKETFFPFFLFAFCVPTGSVIDTITFWLRMISTTLTEFLSHDVLGVPLVQQGTILIKPDHHAFEVIAQCSGLRSFMALLVITIIYSMVSFQNWGKRVLLVAVTVPLAVSCNVLRLTAMVVADRAFGIRAGELVHDSDWIFTYGIAIAVIMALGHWLRETPAAATP
jgi:exosortase